MRRSGHAVCLVGDHSGSWCDKIVVIPVISYLIEIVSVELVLYCSQFNFDLAICAFISLMTLSGSLLSL